VTEAVLVRAPIGLVYRTLTDLDSWPVWLDGCRSQRRDVATDRTRDHHLLVLPGVHRGAHRGVHRPLRLVVTVSDWRHDAGVRWEVRWQQQGGGGVEAEWWLEGRREGAVVHHVVHDAPTGAREARAVRRYRGSIVSALQAMKDRLELAVAIAAGRVP